MRLDDIEISIESNSNKNMLLYLWLSDNYESLNLDKFDYIILDTHPGFSTATKNAIIVSHSMFSPITPSENGYNSKFNLEERIKYLKNEAIDFSTRKSYVTAGLYYIANMVKHNTKSFKELATVLENDSTVIGSIPEKELLNRTFLDRKPISDLEKDHSIYIKHRNFFESINHTFHAIKEKI